MEQGDGMMDSVAMAGAWGARRFCGGEADYTGRFMPSLRYALWWRHRTSKRYEYMIVNLDEQCNQENFSWHVSSQACSRAPLCTGIIIGRRWLLVDTICRNASVSMLML